MTFEIDDVFVLCIGIGSAHYDSAYKAHRQLCLSILKRLGFGQRSVMETRILTEVEQMMNKAREEQGRPFDVRQLTASCVANVIMSMVFGRRFDLCDSAFQQLISDVNTAMENFMPILEIFPILRFLPYFKNSLATYMSAYQNVIAVISNNVATCIEVCSNSYCLLMEITQSHGSAGLL